MKDATSILNRELKENNSYPFCYVYKGYAIEISAFNHTHNLDVDLSNTVWESNIYCWDCSIVTVGYYRTQIKAVLRVEETINQW